MGYRQCQTQAHCSRCGKPMLHTRIRYDVPHGVHLVTVLVLGAIGMFLFWPVLGLAVLWLGVWFIHALADGLHNLINADAAYRCARCGQRMGTLPPEQIAANAEPAVAPQKHETDIMKRCRLDRERAEQHEAERCEAEREARRPHLEEIRRAQARRRREFDVAVWRACCRFPGRIDAALKTLAGEDNEIIYRFFQVVYVAGLLGAVGLLVWWWW